MTIHKSATIKLLDGKASGPWDILISTDRLDRDRDTINQLGWRINDYMKNPVVMWSHDYHGFTPAGGVPIGATSKLAVDAQGLIATFNFRKPANEHDFVNVIRTAWDQEVLRAASVGFNPIERAENEAGGIAFNVQDLLEWSICAIPANADALRRSFESALKAAGMDALLKIKSAKDASHEPHTEPTTDDPSAATTDDDIELTAEQETALANALAQLTQNLTSVLIGD